MIFVQKLLWRGRFRFDSGRTPIVLPVGEEPENGGGDTAQSTQDRKLGWRNSQFVQGKTRQPDGQGEDQGKKGEVQGEDPA